MVKYASSLFVAALVAAPALAQTTWEEFDTREYDDLFARHPDEAGLTAREPYEQAPTSIFARAGDFDESFSRRSYGRTADLDAREIDALYKHAVSQLDQPMFSFFYFMRDAMKRVKAVAHAPPPPVKGSKDLHTTGTSKGAEKPCDEKKKEKGEEKEKEKQQTDSQPSEGKPPAGDTKPEGAPDGAADGTANGGATGAPEARGLSDEDLWERELENILQERDYADDDSLYTRSYYDDEDGIYSRSDDDAYDLYARSDNTYDPLSAREDFHDLD